MATNLRSNDTIQVRIPQGGGSVRDVPLSELNEYISSEEATDITALETYVGDYGSPSGGKGSDIATDLKKVYADVETDDTGLLARAGVLEAAPSATRQTRYGSVSLKAQPAKATGNMRL